MSRFKSVTPLLRRLRRMMTVQDLITGRKVAVRDINGAIRIKPVDKPQFESRLDGPKRA